MNFFKKLFNRQRPIKTTLTITSSNGFHLRPIAKFVNEVKKFNLIISIESKGQSVVATEIPKILSLSLEKEETFILICTGKEAEKTSKHLSSFFVELMNDDKEKTVSPQTDEIYEGTSYKGQTLGQGIGMAPLVKSERIQTIEESSIDIQTAIELSKNELDKLYQENKENENSEIFLAQKELLSSETFNKLDSLDDFKINIAKEIKNLKDSKFESRTDDYQDLEQRVLKQMGIKSTLDLAPYPFILLAKSLLPSDINILNKSAVRGVVLQTGNTTSHIAILLRSAGIPSLIVQEKFTTNARNVILDANSGNLVTAPSKADFKKAEQLKKEFFEAQDKSFEKRHQQAQTLSGQQIKVLANITNLKTAKEAKEQGADGIGLFRTEFLFTEHQPSVEEQTKVYKEVFEIFTDISIRTLDIGGDKSLPYIKIEKEDNPFLGLRGIRFSLQEQTLFKEQLLAIGLALADVPNKKIKIMFPMVSSINEFQEAKDIALKIYKENNINSSNIHFGIMLEVPSVIFAIKEFDKLVDFYSIGSNDLTQYLFAIERTHPTLKVDSTSPILMEALKQIINTTTKPLSICGELAGIESASEQLINIGYTNLSLSSKLIPSLKESIRNL